MSITDPNHNSKRLRYQLIGFSCIPVVGIHVIDSQILQVAGISKDLWCPKDFAFYPLVLKLASSDYIKTFTNRIVIGEDPEAVDSLCTSLYFFRLGLYDVNTKFLDANMLVYFLWCYMIWITSIKNICIIAKRNIVTSTIGIFNFK